MPGLPAQYMGKKETGSGNMILGNELIILKWSQMDGLMMDL